MNEKAWQALETNEEAPGYVTMRVPAAIPTLLPVVLLAIAGLTAWVNLGRDVGDNTRAIAAVDAAQEKKWTEHGDYHREKAAENAGTFARIETRLTAIESVAPKADKLTYRVDSVEVQAASLAKGLADLQQTVNSQSGDIRLMLEILRRQEKAAGFSARPR